MKRPARAQLSILAGVLGFFLGGLINSSKELVDVMLGAAIGWGIMFFVVYMALENLYKDPEAQSSEEKDGEARVKKSGDERSKGKKIDITLKDNNSFDDIYRIK